MSGIGISPCPPFNKGSLVPGVLFDGNTVAWFRSYIYASVIRDGANRVSEWRDVSGNNRHLLQGVAASQPIWSAADGVLFDGVNDFMKAIAFAFVQPEFIYFVGKEITWTDNDSIFDGNVSYSGAYFQRNVSPTHRVYAGNTVDYIPAVVLNNDYILRLLFNGVNSSIQINQLAVKNDNFGAANMGNFTLGSIGSGGSNWSHIQVKEIILRRTADNAAIQTSIYNYLKNINSVP